MMLEERSPRFTIRYMDTPNVFDGLSHQELSYRNQKGSYFGFRSILGLTIKKRVHILFQKEPPNFWYSMTMTTTTMMKAMRLTYKTSLAKAVEIERPSVVVDSSNNKEILVQVKYSAIDTALDAVVQKKFTGSFLHARTDPLVLGWHFVGTVVDIGAAGVGVQKTDDDDDDDDDHDALLAVGDSVWGFLPYDSGNKQGTLAECIKVRHDQCGRIPKNNSNTLEKTITMMAASSTETLTALQAMRDCGGLNKGKTILILGAGGAVGSAAVQIAKILGAHVTAVCSTKDYDHVNAFGADVVIDRSKQDPLAGAALYDVIFDTTGQYSATKGLRKLQPKGTFVATLPSLSLVAGMILSFFRRGKKSCKMIQCHSNRADLDLVASWIAEKKLLIDVDSIYDIKDLEKAIARHQGKAKVGRVAIRVEGGW
jgi:NADPH:quinone reductase-like Zn-dependent oxidoreductase